MNSDKIKEFASLRRALEQEKADIEGQLDAINEALGTNGGVAEAPVVGRVAPPKIARRQMSAAAKKRIAAAQRVRWAKQRGQAAEDGSSQKIEMKSAASDIVQAKRTMSPSARKKLAAAAKARWAKAKAAGKSRL